MKEFRVAEIFGPTIQGEGRHIGVPCYFVRFGGCDFRCSWCDTPHAVLPDQVANLEKMNAWQIHSKLIHLQGKPEWVVLSGGNPGLLDLTELIHIVKADGMKVMVETQGSTYREWYNKVDEMCFSPKPPSSGMEQDLAFLDRIFGKMWVQHNHPWPFYLKVVVFDEVDYEWALLLREKFSGIDFFMSVGNEDPALPTVGNPNPDNNSLVPLEDTRDIVLDKMKWLMERVATDDRARDIRVLPQLHTLAWGNARGR